MNTSIFSVKPHSPGVAEIRVKNDVETTADKSLTLLFANSPATPPTQPIEQFIDPQTHDLVLLVDADALSETVLEGAPYQIKIPELDLAGSVLWPLIPSRRSEDKNVTSNPFAARPIMPQPVAAPPPLQEDYLPPPPAQTLPPPPVMEAEEPWHSLATPSKEKHKGLFIWIIVALILGILILAAILWGVGVFSPEKPHSAPPIKAAASTPPPTPPASTVSLEQLSVPDVITKAPNVASIGQEGLRRLQGNQKDDGVLLLEAAANKGDGPAMLALAQLYNPATFKQGGPVPSPDIRESARYFQKAAQANVAEAIQPRTVLHDYLEDQAKKGNMTAQLALKDFWP